MSGWEAAIQRAQDEFIEGMGRLGFRLAPGGQSLEGEVTVPDGSGLSSRSIEVCLPSGFPFRSAKVRPTDGSGAMSWHRERDGWLCLYGEAENGDLPWLHPAAFLDRVVQWFVSDREGWPDDAPDLDLERYFEPAIGLVIFKDIDQLIGKPIHAKRRGRVIEVVGTGVAPRGRRQRKNVYGWVEDLGELNSPPHDWTELAAVLGNRAARLSEEIRRGRGELLLLRYRRREQSGVVALSALPGSPIVLRAFQVADVGEKTLHLRAGSDFAVLGTKSVAIIGVGALGSFLADLLARSGTRQLELWDGQVLRPGNCVRHLAGLSYVGRKKADAVADILVSQHRLPANQVKAVPEELVDPVKGHELLQASDLVVDTTATGPVTAMLSFIAKTTGRPLISVCLQRGGGIVRCDRWPLAPGEAHAPPIPMAVFTGPVLREAGCGDPISPAPPWAVLEAAGLACRVTTDILTGRKTFGPSVVQVLVPQNDPPYDRLTTFN